MSSHGDNLNEVGAAHNSHQLPISFDRHALDRVCLQADRISLDIPLADANIREKLLAHLRQQSWAHPWLLNVLVKDGIVNLSGVVPTDAERAAVRIAAESTPGVRAVNNNLVVRPWLE